MPVSPMDSELEERIAAREADLRGLLAEVGRIQRHVREMLHFPDEKRGAVRFLQDHGGLSERRACQLLGVSRATVQRREPDLERLRAIEALVRERETGSGEGYRVLAERAQVSPKTAYGILRRKGLSTAPPRPSEED